MTETFDRHPHLQQAIDTALRPSRRALRACERLGIRTVAQFLTVPRDRFVALPGGGERAYAEVDRRLRAWLAQSLGDPDGAHDERRPVLPLVPTPAAARALRDLGIRTVGEFLATPREQVLGCRGVGRRTWERIVEAIERTRPSPANVPPLSLLPDTLRKLPLTRLGLPMAHLRDYAHLGCITVGHALALPGRVWAERGELGTAVADALRTALAVAVNVGLAQVAPAAARDEQDWPTLRGRLLAALDADERALLRERIGLGVAARSTPQHAARLGQPLETLTPRDDSLRQHLHERVPTLLDGLRQEIRRELDANDGIVRSHRLPASSQLQTIAAGSGDPALPLRLGAFCFPEEFHCHGAWLSRLSARATAQLLRLLRGLTPPRRLPRPLSELLEPLRAVVDPVPRGPLLQLLAESCRVRVQVDPERGEIVVPQLASPTARLVELLAETGQPVAFEDLLFDYRERFRGANRHRLRGRLHTDPAFLEIEPGVFSLRAWHQDELAAAAPRAEQVARQIADEGGRHHVAALLPEASTRTIQLVLDVLRRDGRLRYLGRGDFCPASHTRSHALETLLQDFRRAAGEVVHSRFVANQPAVSRRLVQRLLELNRLFVFPAPDRIDVLTNYPFNPERLQRLVEVVDAFLGARNGYAPLRTLLDHVNQTDLGGGWLTPTLLGELLRRHGPFEVLPGGIVARGTLGLGSWLMRRARHALRSACTPISLQEILAERPELAEFADCLSGLLQQDPLVQTPDGQRYQIA